MSPDQERRIQDVFIAGHDLLPPAWTAFPERACGDDAEHHRQADKHFAARNNNQACSYE